MNNKFESKEIHGMKVVPGSFEDLTTFYVQSAKVVIDDVEVVVNLGLSKAMSNSPDAEFLPNKVTVNGDTVWAYKVMKGAYASCIAKMHVYKNEAGVKEHIIGLHGKFNNDSKYGLMAVVPLIDLVNGIPVMLGDHFTFLNPRECLTNLKIKVGKQLGFNIIFNDSDLEILNAAREENERLEMAKKEERYAKRKIIKAIIAMRPSVTVYADNGCQYYGTPVVVTNGSDEIKYLSVGTFIGVSSYNDETKVVGDPVEAFRMILDYGNMKKIPVPHCKLSFEKQVKNLATVITGERIFLIKDDKKNDYPLFSLDNIRAIVAKSGNTEILVAIDNPREDGYYPLVSIKKGQQKIVGHYARAA